MHNKNNLLVLETDKLKVPPFCQPLGKAVYVDDSSQASSEDCNAAQLPFHS